MRIQYQGATVKLQELKEALRAVNPAAVLLPPRVLSRVIQRVHKLPSQFLSIPHQKTYVLDRQVLFRHVEQDELDLDPDQLLPPTVILLARPSTEKLSQLDREAILLKYWRRLFHASVHLALERRFTENPLSASDLRLRLEQIGLTEFEEIRTVLGQDLYLLPPADDQQVYIEFAAVYLEQRYFMPNLRAVYFPGLGGDYTRIDRLLAQDIDPDALFASTRLPGAPAPVVKSDCSSDESDDYYWKLVHSAERAARAGNTVRAAILRTRAARVAPGALTLGTRAEAQADLQRLTARLQAALKLNEQEAVEWAKDLPALLDKADQGYWAVEARLLYDLQKVCLDHEKDVYALDVVEWVISAGKRPIKRPLPSQRIVRITKHLRSAAERLTGARLLDSDRQHLSRLMQTALKQTEERLRERFRPILTAAFHDVGLEPRNLPERTAFHKIIEELLDRISAYGFLTFSDLRDSISRNQLKMPDLADPQEFVRGDMLLRLDRRLATLLDGVYRPGEVYLRWLNRVGSLSFGTLVGRFLTRFLVVPFGGAYVLLQGLQMIAADKLSALVHREVSFYPELLFFPLGLFLLGLLYVPTIRRATWKTCWLTYRVVHGLFLDLPVKVVRHPAVQILRRSWLLQLLYWYILKPLVASALIWWLVPETFSTVVNAVITLLAAALLLNSRFGMAASELLTRALLQLYDWLRSDFLGGLFRLILYIFKQISDTMEYVLYSVDEWLRFQSGGSRFSLALRTVLGIIWFPISYLARLYFMTMIEPTINPIKLPISSVAFKFFLFIPWYYAFMFPPFSGQEAMMTYLVPHLGATFAYVVTWVVVVPTLWLLPSVVAFFIWEMQADWRLYRANRPEKLSPVMIGHHGETMLQLLKPGFHSGTIPRLYAHLRHAERHATRTGVWRTARAYHHALQEVEHLVRLFLERELLTLLRLSRTWSNQPLTVGDISLAGNRIGVELRHGDHPKAPLRLAFEEHAGWLTAGVPQSGWLAHLSREQIESLTNAVAGLYKLAGVALVREQIRAALPRELTAFQIDQRGLRAQVELRPGEEVIYPLDVDRVRLKPLTLDGKAATGWPAVPAEQLLFLLTPLCWRNWVETWQRDQDGKEQLALFPDQHLLPAVGKKTMLAVEEEVLAELPAAPPGEV
jgi:hypothetical protein